MGSCFSTSYYGLPSLVSVSLLCLCCLTLFALYLASALRRPTICTRRLFLDITAVVFTIEFEFKFEASQSESDRALGPPRSPYCPSLSVWDPDRSGTRILAA